MEKLEIPRSRVVYDSGYIATCTQNAPSHGAAAQVVLIGSDERSRAERVTDLVTLILRIFLRREANAICFPTRPTEMRDKRFRIIVVEDEPRLARPFEQEVA